MAGEFLRGRSWSAGCGLGLLAAYAGLVVAGAIGWLPLFVVVAVLVAAAEITVRRTPQALRLLAAAGIRSTHRHAARDAAVLLLLARSGVVPEAVLLSVALLMAAVWAASLGMSAAAVVINTVILPPISVRNVDLSGVLPSAPHRRLRAWVGERAIYANLLVMLAAIAALALDTPVLVPVAAALAVTGAVALAVVTAGWLLRAWRGRSRMATLGLARARVRPAPQVVLYFAGSGADVYQVNMWLATVEALDQPALVVLRDDSCFEALAPTSLPVVCIPGGTDLMNFGFDSVRAALYPSNTAKNIHMLREPGMKHVFVGHGDSDKIASINPYSKVYDEIWVAGRAGRDRYAAAAVGVRDEEIVEVGRPQLAGIATTGSAPDGPYTVLYAPTWEGWVEDPHATSLLRLGERIVSELLALPVRVWYRPHPLTGTRSPAARAAHGRLVELLRAAGATTSQVERAVPGIGHHVFAGAHTPSLYDCFNRSDLLISDVSSVLSDWIASRKAYVVGNTRDLPADEFRNRYPTARAAYLLSSDAGELAQVVRLTQAGDDPMARDRRALSEYLLGPAAPPALQRFQAEVTRLCGVP